MRAVELVAAFPTVGLGTPAIEAARLLANENLPGLIVLDDRGRPSTILPGTQVLTPLIAVVARDRSLVGAITLDALLDRLVGQ
jgi:hypothetical protein